jgi:hypothetical protein
VTPDELDALVAEYACGGDCASECQCLTQGHALRDALERCRPAVQLLDNIRKMATNEQTGWELFRENGREGDPTPKQAVVIFRALVTMAHNP